MGKDTESGRRSPSIIARLMGLDGLPASHNVTKKQKRPSDSHQRGSSSPGFSKNSKCHDNRSHRKQHSFKDVYEVKDRSHVETRSSTSRAASNRSYHEDEIGFIRQKFMDAKRLYTDENFQHSKEFHDTIEVLNSNKDLLVRFLQEPNSLYSKHLHDLYHIPESYYGSKVGTNSNNALKCNIDVIGCQTGEASRKIDISQSYKHWNNCYSNMYDRRSTDLCKLNISAEGNANASSNPTKIVVLKPNLGKTVNITKSTPSISSRGLQSDFEFSPVHSVVEVRSKRSKDDDSDSYGRKSRESRELARDITRRMKNKLGRDSLYFSSSGSKGYSADESSHDTSENESSYESEMTIVSSRTSSNRTLRNKSSSLRYMESSVNTEAQKRISERWKMVHRPQEIGESSKGSTLAEMLAVPDMDIRPQSPNANIAQDGYFGRPERTDRIAGFSPLGISSRDGWKDGYIQNLSRSRSLPNSGNHLRSPKSSSKCEPITPERFLVRKENIGHVRNKPIKRDFRRKDGYFLENKKPSDGKCLSFSPLEVVDDINNVQPSRNLMKNSIDGKDSPEVKTVILETPSSVHDACILYNEEVPAQESRSCASPQNGLSSSSMSSLPQVGGSSYLQCTATHLESPASSKESEQPSPVSVLEAPFVEDLSSGSECFERVSAELNGLRMQLQLLKQESEVYDEESMLISSNECADESTELCDDNYLTRLEECWESCYLVDVLALSGLDQIDCEFFLAAWHSPDCPIAPWVFEDLEKRYGELESCSKSERKLLYDNINSRIVEITKQFVDTEPWVKKQGKNINPQWLNDVLQIELQKIIDKHEKKATENELDMMILRNMGWMMLEEHISAIGRDIEALLIDELVSEALHV